MLQALLGDASGSLVGIMLDLAGGGGSILAVPLQVGGLERLLEMRQPYLSQHLTRLGAEGLVKTRREARTVDYSLGSEPAERVIDLLHELFCAKDAPGRDEAAPATDKTGDA